MCVRREAMSATTQCPTCNTRFKVTQEQLDAHQGLVRCGCCQAVFNATEYLQGGQPSPQLDLPIAPEAPLEPAVETSIEIPVETAAEPAPATNEELDFSPTEPAYPEPQDTDRQDTEPQAIIEPAEPITLAQKITFADSPAAPSPDLTKKKKKYTWPWIVGSLLLSILLLAQATYFFRVELAAYQPGLKSALISYCRLLQCTVPLPQKADLMSIESSELEADPVQSSVITLNALLRNHAPYMQAYPDLELTLTDAQDKPLARRNFRPAEYLKSGEDEKQGLAANRELSVKLNLDTTDLKPSGYRLLLFYPQ
jgi:predicted Zn finger-like uncharacterized protein